MAQYIAADSWSVTGITGSVACFRGSSRRAIQSRGREPAVKAVKHTAPSWTSPCPTRSPRAIRSRERQRAARGARARPGPCPKGRTRVGSTAPFFTYGRDMSRPRVRDMTHLPPARSSLAASGKSHAEAKNGDCHQFAPRHGPRNKALGLKGIGWLYPIFRDLHFHHGLLGVFLLLFAIGLPLQAGEIVSIEVERDRLTAADLARVMPQWKSLDGNRMIAYAPLPGVERRVSRRQLIRWADRHGLKLNIRRPSRGCSGRPTHAPAQRG